MAQTSKAKSASRKKPANATKAPAKRSAVPAKAAKPKGRRETDDQGGLENIAKLLDHPLVADLLAVGAIAAVAAIADHSVRTRTGEAESGSSKALKAAGKAAAAAVGKRLMTEVDAIKKASAEDRTKRGSK
jgi:hypothetical protein